MRLKNVLAENIFFKSYLRANHKQLIKGRVVCYKVEFGSRVHSECLLCFQAQGNCLVVHLLQDQHWCCLVNYTIRVHFIRLD